MTQGKLLTCSLAEAAQLPEPFEGGASSTMDSVRLMGIYTVIPISVRKRDGAFEYPKYLAA